MASAGPLGWVRSRRGRWLRIDSQQDWAWITRAHEAGHAYVISCSDRFSTPPEYYSVAVHRPEDLDAALRDIERRTRQEVLAVFDTREAPRTTPPD